MIPGARRLGVRITSRMLVVAVAGIVLGVLLAMPEVEGEEIPLGLAVVISVVAGWLALGLYEVAARGTAAVLGGLVGPLDPEALARSRRTAFTPLRALAVLLVYVATMTIVGIGLYVIVALSGSAEGLSRTLEPSQMAWILTVSAVVGIVAVWAVLRGMLTPRDRVKMRRWLRWPGSRAVEVGVLGGLLFAVVATKVLPHVLPVSETYKPGAVVRLAMAVGWSRVLVAVLAVVLAPPVEEVLFRGVLLEGMLRTFSRYAAILATTGLFALMHVPDILGNGPGLAAVLVAGYALAEFRLRTKSLLPPIAAHMAYNAVVMAFIMTV